MKNYGTVVPEGAFSYALIKSVIPIKKFENIRRIGDD